MRRGLVVEKNREVASVKLRKIEIATEVEVVMVTMTLREENDGIQSPIVRCHHIQFSPLTHSDCRVPIATKTEIEKETVSETTTEKEAETETETGTR